MKRIDGVFSKLQNKTTGIFIIVAVAVIVGLISIYLSLAPPATQDPAVPHYTSLNRQSLSKQTQTGALELRPKSTNADQSEGEEPAMEPFVVQSLLDEIKLDEDGNVVLDDHARRLLEKSILMLGRDQSQLTLELLDQMIRASLPGHAGGQVADIFRSYYEYKSAEGELVAALEASSGGSGEDALDQLAQLRYGYLGYETTLKLFEEEDAYMRNVLMLMDKAQSEAKVDQ